MNPSVLAFLLAFGLAALGAAGAGPSWPSPAELSTKLRTERPELPEPAASIQDSESYVRSLHPWVLPPADPADPAAMSPLSKTNRYAGGAAYLRIATVNASLPAALSSAAGALLQEGPVSGWVLDLRFAHGTAHRSAVEAASFWCSKDSGEFRLADETYRLSRNDQAPSAPVLILINRQTRQAAETLGLALRLTAARALTLGTHSAGEARVYRPLPIADGLSLRLAGDALRLPDGSEFSTNGLLPDVVIAIPEDDERAYAKDEYRRVSQGQPMVAAGANRLNEAELVRRRRSPRSNAAFANPHHRSGDRSRGGSESAGAATPDRESTTPPEAVQDPALALALDLISGVAADASGSEGSPKSSSEGESR